MRPTKIALPRLSGFHSNYLSLRVAHWCHSARHSSSTSTTKRPPFHVWFFGNDQFSVDVLRRLRDAPDVWQSLRVIVTDHKSSVGHHGKEAWTSGMQKYAEEENLSWYPYESARRKWLPRTGFTEDDPVPPENESPDDPDVSTYLMITASFGKLAADDLLNAFNPDRRLNLHPSLLPDLRGPAPIVAVLLRGSPLTGVSVISLQEKNKGVDAGPIWEQQLMSIAQDDNYLELRNKLAKLGGDCLVSVMRKMLADEASSVPQPVEHTSAKKVNVASSVIHWDVHSAAHVLRMYRSVAFHFKLRTKLPKSLRKPGSNYLLLPKVELYPGVTAGIEKPGQAIYNPETAALHIRCIHGEELQASNVQMESRKAVSAKDWWDTLKGQSIVDFCAQNGDEGHGDEGQLPAKSSSPLDRSTSAVDAETGIISVSDTHSIPFRL